MKRTNPGLLVAVLAVLVAAAAEAQVYRTVDENGNVVYTDQPPSPEAEPMDLPGLSVVEVPNYRRDAVRPRESAGNAEGEVTDLRALRRGYRDFRIVAPMPDETFWGTGNEAMVAWETQYELQEGMSVVVYIDNQRQPPTTDRVIPTGQLDRGEHQVHAELLDARQRTIARAEPVTFHIKQQSVLLNRPVAPAGGG